ncbi:hypothetical protein SDC9_88954 [bioreactor metagenome]|uniref:Uncharacterized protein n=1 Tax=bioreactor metagenome TaxID=1076179 RepID=A0A644ZMX0_9ZZZZ
MLQCFFHLVRGGIPTIRRELGAGLNDFFQACGLQLWQRPPRLGFTREQPADEDAQRKDIGSIVGLRKPILLRWRKIRRAKIARVLAGGGVILPRNTKIDQPDLFP